MKFFGIKSKHKGEKKFLKKRQNFTRETKQFINLNKAQTIGIIYDDINKNKTQSILNFIKELTQKNKNVRTIGYIPDPIELNKQLRYADIHYFSEKDVKICGEPSLIQISNFMNTVFDILIDVCTNFELPTRYISTFSKAQFKTGIYATNKDYLDVMIKEKNIDLFFTQIKNLLYKINDNE